MFTGVQTSCCDMHDVTWPSQFFDNELTDPEIPSLRKEFNTESLVAHPTPAIDNKILSRIPSVGIGVLKVLRYGAL